MTDTRVAEHVAVAIVGGGQAGLSMSWHLCRLGIDHVVLERNRVGHEWREARWDTFCLVTPNWQCDLPGFPYAGDDPDGFMVKDEIVAYLEDYAASFHPPLREGVSVISVTRKANGFAIETSGGPLHADQVVVATGGYHLPVIPRLAERVPAGITQLHSQDYKNPGELPDGAVLVVGSGQSGAQIAEDLHLAGRTVHLAVGSAPRVARFYRGRDVVTWLADMGYYEMPVTRHPLGEGVRHNANHYVTGRDGGRDIDLRRFAHEGMHLYGHLADVSGGVVTFKSDLKHSLDHADEVSESIKDSVDKFIAEKGLSAPSEPRYMPVWEPAADQALQLDLVAAGITSVVWCIGFTGDYRWIDVPIFNGQGYPTHERGVTREAGLYFLGLPWQWTWGSGRFSGVARDAEHLAGIIRSRYDRERTRLDGSTPLNALALGS